MANSATGWTEIFDYITDVIEELCARNGCAFRADIASFLLSQPDILGSKSADNSVDWFSAKFTTGDKSVSKALTKFSRTKFDGKWVYFLKGNETKVADSIQRRSATLGRIQPIRKNKFSATSQTISAPSIETPDETTTTSPEPESITPSQSIATFNAQSLLNDTAILQAASDRLGFGTSAEAIASFIASEKTSTPLVMAVNAPWGTGKSSLVNMILNKLERRLTFEGFLYMLRRTARFRRTYERWRKLQPGSTLQRIGEAIRFARPPQRRLKHTILRFDAWMHDDAKSIVSAFTRQVFYRANSARHLGFQIVNPVSYQYSGRIARVGILATCGFVGYPLIGFIYAELVAHGILPHLFLHQVLSALKIPDITTATAVPAGVTILGLLGKQVKEVQDTVQKFIKNPEKSADEATLVRVNEKLRGLLQQATTRRRRFIIYIDNLERCKPENALALLEVVNQLLNHPQVITIIAADMELIAASAGSRFKDQAKMLATTAENEQGICLDFGRRYVRKMVQMNITVPRPSMAGLRSLVGGKDETR